MRIDRVKIVALDEDGKVLAMRTAFEHNASEVVEKFQKEFAAGGNSYVDRDGDYIVLTAAAWAVHEASTPAQQPARGGRNRGR